MDHGLSLYPIQQQHLTLLSLIEDAEGELTPEIEQALQLTQVEFEAQAVSVGFLVLKTENEEEMIDKELNRLKSLKEKATKRKELFKQRLKEAMQLFGFTEIKTATLKLSFRASESVEITDEGLVPEEFKELVPESYKTSKTAIKAAIKEGKNVLGATLVKNQNLQIK